MVKVNMLVLAVTAMLTWSEAVVLNKCDLTSRLKEAFLVFDRLAHQDVLAQFICTVEHTTRFNTSVISINGFKPEPMTPTTTIYGQGEKEQSGLLTEIVTEDYLTPDTRLRRDVAGNEDPFTALEVMLEDYYGDYLGEEPSEESGRDFIYWSEEGFTNHSGEGSGEEFSGSGSRNYSGERSGEEIFGSGSGNYSGDGSGDDFSGSGSKEASGIQYEIIKIAKREVHIDMFGDDSMEGSGNEYSEGSGDDFSGSGSREASGGLYEGRSKREVPTDMFGDDSMEGSGNEYSEESGDDFSGSGSREASGGLYEGRSKREVPRANFGDGFTEGSGNEFNEGSGIYPESQHEKRAFHKVEDLQNLKTTTPDDEQKSSSEEQRDDSISQKLLGIFQLADYFACNSGSNHNLNLCQMDCTALTDDDITDDIACLKILNVFGISTMVSAQCETVTSAEYLAECH